MVTRRDGLPSEYGFGREHPGYKRALESVRTPGTLGEIATVGLGVYVEKPGVVDVFIQHYEEPVGYSPAEARALAWRLFVAADIAERAVAPSPTGDREREALPDHFDLTDEDLLASWEDSTSASSAFPYVPASRLRSFLAALRLRTVEVVPAPAEAQEGKR